jgi:ABC-2 type transport system ATP-binding protein
MQPIASPVLELIEFTKRYEDFTAVHPLSFAVNPGEIVGIVGTNGAGKTTTLRAIVGLLRPSGGCIRVAGMNPENDPVAIKQLLAYIPDNTQPFDLLTVTEHLHFTALAYRIENAEIQYDSLLEELDLSAKRHSLASSLSRGMEQKLSMACAFLRNPEIIILDEPLTGLDPRGIRNIKSSIRRRANQGTAFLLSSHLLGLVEELCDRVLVMHEGKRISFGSLSDVRAGANLDCDAPLEDVFMAVTDGLHNTALHESP